MEHQTDIPDSRYIYYHTEMQGGTISCNPGLNHPTKNTAEE